MRLLLYRSRVASIDLCMCDLAGFRFLFGISTCSSLSFTVCIELLPSSPTSMVFKFCHWLSCFYSTSAAVVYAIVGNSAALLSYADCSFKFFLSTNYRLLYFFSTSIVLLIYCLSLSCFIFCQYNCWNFGSSGT